MKLLVSLVVVAIAFFGIRACLSDAPTAGKITSAAAPVDVLHVTDLDGNPKEISLTSDTSVLYLATWCPHSEAFKKMLNDPSVKSKMEGHNVVAVFGREEWKTVRSELHDSLKAGSYTQEQYDTALKNIAQREKKSIFFDPSFFEDLTIPTYVGAIPRKADGYPSVEVGDSFYSAAQWMQKELNMSIHDVNQCYASYDPAQ